MNRDICPWIVALLLLLMGVGVFISDKDTPPEPVPSYAELMQDNYYHEQLAEKYRRTIDEMVLHYKDWEPPFPGPLKDGVSLEEEAAKREHFNIAKAWENQQ